MTKIKIAIFGAVVFAIALVVFLGYQHYNSKLTQIETLKANNATLELSVQVQGDTITAAEQTIRDWEEALRRVEQRNRQLEGITNDARVEQERLQGIFDELDFSGNPEDLASDINRRFSYTSCLLERATGSSGPDCSSKLDPGPDTTTLSITPGPSIP